MKKPFKKIGAMLLCLFLLCGLPFAVGAADTVSMEKAVFVTADANTATFEVTFSAPVTFPAKGSGISLMPQEYNAGCAGGAQYQSWTPTVTYTGDITEKDGANYSRTVLMKFKKCGNHGTNFEANHTGVWGADGKTMPENIFITFALDNQPDATSIETNKVVGINGEALAVTGKHGNSTYAAIKPTYGDPSSFILLKKAAVVAADENGYTVEATFTDSVHLSKTGGIWVVSKTHQLGDGQEDNCQNWALQNIEYVGSDTEYSSVLRLSYTYCATHKHLWIDKNGNYKVPDTEEFASGAYLFVNDFGNGHTGGSAFMSTSVISGENGKPVVQTGIENAGASNEYGELYAPLENEIPIQMTHAAVTDISDTGVTVKATFSAPVRLIQRQYNKFCLVPTAAGGGCSASNWQMWKHSNVIYQNPQVNASGEEYSRELVMTFTYCTCANAAAHRAVWTDGDAFTMPESVWLYLDDSAQQEPADLGHLSTALIAGIDGQPIARMSSGKTSSNTVTSRVHVQAIDDRNGTGGVDVGEPFEANENTTYSFMNADTGRELAVDGNGEFSLIGKGNNKYAIMQGGQYLNLQGSAPALADDEVLYVIRPAANERYQILSGAQAIIDTDAGSTDAVTLGKTNESNPVIASGWYLTEAGESKPLRILPFGDSITYGVGDTAPQMGWRDNLSMDLDTKLDRYVFVGSQVTKQTTLADTELAHHEGNPGWTIQDRPSANQAGATVEGIYDLAAGLVAKYAPDITLMMIGTNDLFHSAYADENKKVEADDIAAMLDSYEDLIAALCHNDPRQTVFCSTITPTTSSTIKGQETLFNAVFPAFIQEMAQQYPVVLNDNYSALANDNLAEYLTDGTHLTEAGNVRISKTYADSIVSVYRADGTKKPLTERMCGAQGVLYLNADADVDGTLTVPAGVTLDLNGWTVTADAVMVCGAIADGTQGEGLVAVAKGALKFTEAADGGVMPLYDAEGYRIFDVEVRQHKHRASDSKAEFGVAIMLGEGFNEKAYQLLMHEDNADVTLTFQILLNGDTPLVYTIKRATLVAYAERVLATPDRLGNLVIVLSVYGVDSMSEGMTLSVTPVLASDTCAKALGEPQEYKRTLS